MCARASGMSLAPLPGRDSGVARERQWRLKEGAIFLPVTRLRAHRNEHHCGERSEARRGGWDGRGRGEAGRDLGAGGGSLHRVGGATAAAALASAFPMGTARALAQEKPGPLEKKDLKIGFIPITCATPIIMAEPMAFYKKHGLNVQVVKASS